MLIFHAWQRMICHRAQRPILNACSKEDPANLAELYDAINLDLLTYDPHTGTDLTKLKNFVQGDVTNLPWDKPTFGTVVLGEILEHCTEETALKILLEAKRVLLPNGQIICTFPLDSRPPHLQHAAHLLVEWSPGITSYHQTVWFDDKFFTLLSKANLTLIDRVPLDYPFLKNQREMGWGIILEPF